MGGLERDRARQIERKAAVVNMLQRAALCYLPCMQYRNTYVRRPPSCMRMSMSNACSRGRTSSERSARLTAAPTGTSSSHAWDARSASAKDCLTA